MRCCGTASWCGGVAACSTGSGAPGTSGRVASSHGRLPVSRVPSSGVGHDDVGPRAALRCRARLARRDLGWRGGARRRGRRPGIRRAASRPGGPALALGGHEVADRGGDLLAEAAHVVGVVGAEDVGRHALLEGERRELLGPVGRRARGGAGRPRRTSPRRCRGAARRPGSRPASRAASSMRAFIGPSASGAAYPMLGSQPSARRPVSPEHARLVGADPDADGVRRRGPGVQAARAVVLTVDAHGSPRRTTRRG